ncbi:hypothetical protein [Streptomyces sp. NPDC056683]|uniref:hypothetical protein n=1 Tax=Streptomyces sp. NPDC056683 TaxID=3345910 RepID=UPI0036894196
MTVSASLRLPAPVAVAAWSAELTVACLGTEYGELRCFEVGDGRVVTRWRVRLPAAATCLALDAACGRIAAGCDDGVTRLLDVLDQGREIAAFATPVKEEVTSLPRRQNTRARPEAGGGCQSALPVKRGSGGIGVSEGRVDR